MSSKPTIEYADFEKIEMRVGEILEATAPSWSTKLLQFSVSFGEELGTKTILSGIKEWYSPESFVGKKYPFVINLAPRKMGKPDLGSNQGAYSEGMMIMTDNPDQPRPFALPEQSEVGAIIR